MTALYQPVPGGYRYYLTVYNNMSPASSNHVNALDAFLSLASDPEGPPNWPYIWTHSWVVIWATAESASGGWWKGIPPGKSLSGFNVTTPALAERFLYTVWWYNGTHGSSTSGYAYPTLIPEPSSLLALGSGLGALGLSRRRRRWRRVES